MRVEMVFAIVTIVALAIGLISMTIGWVVELWDRLVAWWDLGMPWRETRAYVTSIDARETDDSDGTEAVHVPVRGPNDEPVRLEYEPVGPNAILPDTEASNHHMVDITQFRRPTDTELITWLAVMRMTDDNKYRFSANKIVEIVGGTRGEVLAKVREIRDGVPPPQYAPLTPEQQQLREELEQV